jgi:hypothetical protein
MIKLAALSALGLVGQTFGEQSCGGFIDARLAGFRERLDLFDQFAIEFDRKRHQALRLFELALFAARQGGAGSTAKTVRRAGLFHLTRNFQAFVSIKIGFFHGGFLDCIDTPSVWAQNSDSISDAVTLRTIPCHTWHQAAAAPVKMKADTRGWMTCPQPASRFATPFICPYPPESRIVWAPSLKGAMD